MYSCSCAGLSKFTEFRTPISAPCTRVPHFTCFYLVVNLCSAIYCLLNLHCHHLIFHIWRALLQCCAPPANDMMSKVDQQQRMATERPKLMPGILPRSMPTLSPAPSLPPRQSTEVPYSLNAQEEASADCVFSEERSQRLKITVNEEPIVTFLFRLVC